MKLTLRPFLQQVFFCFPNDIFSTIKGEFFLFPLFFCSRDTKNLPFKCKEILTSEWSSKSNALKTYSLFIMYFWSIDARFLRPLERKKRCTYILYISVCILSFFWEEKKSLEMSQIYFSLCKMLISLWVAGLVFLASSKTLFFLSFFSWPLKVDNIFTSSGRFRIVHL